MAEDIKALRQYTFRFFERSGRDSKLHYEIEVYELIETQRGIELYHIKPVHTIQADDKNKSDIIKKLAKLISSELECMVLE